jgi:FMN phosphatase YigB (HAD superfamily)
MKNIITNNQPPFSPSTHIFLWDLHDVILTKSLWNWFMICLRYKHKKELISNLDKKSIKIAGAFLLERLKLTKKQMISEELITAARNANNQALVDLTVKTCSSYTPIENTVQIMNELTALGFTHHLGSNIGQTVFNDCAEKFPSIFNVFKGVTIPFESQHATIIKKPHQEFFYAHLNKHNLQPEQIIFIDDKLNNVIAAQSIGINAIHFKNAQQLRNQLIAWNIIEK